MHDEPRDIPPRPAPEEVSGKAVAALILSVLGLTHTCPCVGPVLAIALGLGEKSSVGRAAVVLGVVGLVLHVLLGAALAFNFLIFSWMD